MPLDPQARQYLDRMAELGIRSIEQLGPEEARTQVEAGAPALFGPKEEVASIEDIDVDGTRVRLYTPASGDLPTLVYLHGGGWVVGSVDTHDGTCRALANRAGCRVASVDYRLAPEHPFPAAVEDCWTVTRWAFRLASPAVAVGGDSAGGNLAAVMALRARDAGLPLAFQLLVYPVTDHDHLTDSDREKAEGFGLTLAGMRAYWDHYLGRGDRSHPEASPLRAPSLSGVAPALVVVCEYDVLRDEGVAYAERLRREGVPAQLSEYPGMIHGFVRMAAFTDRTQDVLDECAAALRRAFAVG